MRSLCGSCRRRLTSLTSSTTLESDAVLAKDIETVGLPPPLLWLSRRLHGIVVEAFWMQRTTAPGSP
jgi:hypothetical protein